MFLSRKFLLALVGVIVSAVASYAKVDPALLAAINTLLIALVGAIAVEDFGKNMGGAVQPGHNTVKILINSVWKSRQFRVALAGLIAVILTSYSGQPAAVVEQLTLLFSVAIVGGAVEAAGTSLRP